MNTGARALSASARRVQEALEAAGVATAITVTGYAIGGIPPLAHAQALRTFVDRNLMQYVTVYAAGGTPHAMFPIAPADLVRVAGGDVADTAP